MQAILFLLILLGMLFWIQQIVNVVSMKDEEFEGRNDKLIFFLIVFFGSIPGAIGFWIWKVGRSWSPSESFSFSWKRSSNMISLDEEQAMERMMQEVLEEKRRKDEEKAKIEDKNEKQES